MGQDSCQVGEVAFIDSKETFGLDCLQEAVEYALIKVSVLVIHA